MLKTYLYVPEQLDKQVRAIAREENKSKATVLRDAIQKGLGLIHRRKTGGAEAMLQIAELSGKLKAKGPKDLSENIDKYLWDNYTHK